MDAPCAFRSFTSRARTVRDQGQAPKCATLASFSHFLKLSSLKEENGLPATKDMLKQLTKDHEAIVQHAYVIVAKAQKVHDEATVDVMIERIRAHEKNAWMLRSCLE